MMRNERSSRKPGPAHQRRGRGLSISELAVCSDDRLLSTRGRRRDRLVRLHCHVQAEREDGGETTMVVWMMLI